MPSQSPSRSSIFHDASLRLRADFEEVRNSVPHRGVAGSEGEKILSHFLDDHMPQRFRTTNGFIIDKADSISGQTDIIVYDALNCPVYRTSSTGMIIPSDNAAAVFEVKFDLTTTGLRNDIRKIHNIKNLTKTPHLPQDPPNWLISTFGVIFAFESNLSDESIYRTWHSELAEQNLLHNSCNMIVILDRGIYVPIAIFPDGNAGPITMEGVPPAPAGTTIGLSFFPYGENTLDHMLRILLGQLTFFRPRIDHPGFDFRSTGPRQVYRIGTYNQSGVLEYTTYRRQNTTNR